MIYIVLLIFALFLFWRVSTLKKQYVWAGILLVIMMIMTGIRDNSVGVDSLAYSSMFTVTHDFENVVYEPLNQLLIDFVNIYTREYGWWFLLMSFITYLPIGIAIYLYSKKPLLSVLIYMISAIHLFPETMNVMRQSVAIGFLLLSYLSFVKKKWIYTSLLFAIAVGFHFSSIIVLPFYFICLKDYKKTIVIVALSLSFLFGFFSSDFISIRTISKILPILNEMTKTGVEKFSSASGQNLTAFGLIYTMLPLNVLGLLLIPSEKDEDSYKYLFNFFFFGIILSNLIYCAIPYGFRYSMPFFVVESLLFANKFKYNKNLHYYLAFLIVFYLVYLYSISVSVRGNMIIPYKVNPLFNILL